MLTCLHVMYHWDSQVELVKKREAAKAAAEQRERQANRGWLSWAWGGSGSAPKKEGHEEEEDADMRGELNEEERQALEGLVSEQADALKDGACQPLRNICNTLKCWGDQDVAAESRVVNLLLSRDQRPNCLNCVPVKPCLSSCMIEIFGQEFWYCSLRGSLKFAPTEPAVAAGKTCDCLKL